MKKLLILTIIFASLNLYSQNKMGYTWIVGNNASYGKFDGTSSRPQTGSIYNMSAPNYPYIFDGGHSNICDSVSGKLLFLCNGMVIYDTLGNIMDNGDHLVPNNIYYQNSYPSESSSQSSLILPKGSNGEFYIFIATVSDTTHDKWLLPNATKTPFDMLLYNVVDINANGGMGKVIKKNSPLITNTEMSRTNMQACRHSNGVDWWLLKKVGVEENKIERFLVTKDSIYGPYIQSFSEPDFGIYDATGQMAFSKDGKKYASVQGLSSKLFLADFDRCTGELNNPKIFNIPIDSTGYPLLDSSGYIDNLSGGGCFSPNGNFFYTTKQFNIYQFELNESDSALAWYNVKRGLDTTWAAFESYNSLNLGVDNRIYIGKGAGGFKQFSVIDSPDNKGSACNFCRKCFRVDNAFGGLNSPPNMPDYSLGADNTICWPLSLPYQNKREAFEVYPNPGNTVFYIKNKKGKRKELYNTIGELIYSTTQEELNVSNLNRGIYYLKCGNEVRKVIVE